MKIINVIQGTAEWSMLRAKCNTASEAPAMMGASKYQTRNDLLKQKASGLVPEVDDFKQKLFDKGHAAEAAARSIAEEIINEELFPATSTDDAGYLLASFDGITMGEDVIWEHKLWSESLAESVRYQNLDPHYYWQLEQQLLVSGASRVLFMVSDGTKENCVWMWYTPVAGRAEELLAGWKQFDADVKKYQHVEAKPEAIGKHVVALPALSVQLVGQVTSSNLAVYQKTALAFIADINTDLQTDQDFADAEATIKFCDAAEKELDSVKAHALGQTQSIDELFKTVDNLKEAMRAKRLMLDKLVKGRKESIRMEEILRGNKAITDHFYAMNARLGKNLMPNSTADFATAIKSKRTLTSVRSAIDDEIARARIEASTMADRIEMNLKAIPAEYEFLFADLGAIVTKQADDFLALVKSRVADHQAAEAKRLEAERAKIRAEEEAKARLEAEAKAKLAEEVVRLGAASASTAPAPEATAKPVAIDSGKRASGRLTADEMRRSINACLDRLNDHQLLNVLAYVEGHFIAHAA